MPGMHGLDGDYSSTHRNVIINLGLSFRPGGSSPLHDVIPNRAVVIQFLCAPLLQCSTVPQGAALRLIIMKRSDRVPLT